jgi:hypothetical protein
MTEENHPIIDLTHADLDALLWRAMRNTLILGVLASIVAWIGGGWRGSAMLMIGALISAASIWEWQRMIRVINARMDKQRTPTSSIAVVVFFVLRLTVFALVIYGSLKCLQGSVAALLCGLALAMLTVGWEIVRLLRE